MFIEITEHKSLQSTMPQAIITVIHKKGKDPFKCDSYRPISLLSNDYKILAKILAARLNLVIQKLSIKIRQDS